MINHILNTLRSVSLAKTEGKFLADKSYAFDTVFFLTKFILHNQQNLRFNKKFLRTNAIAYVEDIFQLKKGTAGAVNYYLETLNVLEFANVLSKEDKEIYRIQDIKTLEYIAQYPENAYIFLYLLTWETFKNDGLLDLFDADLFRGKAKRSFRKRRDAKRHRHHAKYRFFLRPDDDGRVCGVLRDEFHPRRGPRRRFDQRHLPCDAYRHRTATLPAHPFIQADGKDQA